MKERKTILTLNQLSRKSLNRMEKFLLSPYHVSNASVATYGSLIIHHIKEDLEIPTDTDLWENIFPNEPYNDIRFRKLNSDLLKAIQSFFGFEQLKMKPETESLLQMEHIIDQKIEPLFNSIKSQLDRSSRYRLDRSAEYFYDRYMEEKLTFEMKSEFERKNRRSDIASDLNIESINDNLDRFYIIEKLKYYATLQSWKKIAKLDIEIDNFNEVFRLIPDAERKKYPVIDIYQKVTEILLNPSNVAAYKELRTLTSHHKDSLPLNDIRYVYEASITYAIDRMNKGDKDFLLEVFNLYQEALSTEGFLTDGKLTPTSYRNIAVIGLRLGKYEWAESFIYEFSEKLEPKYRENALRFSLARLYFYKKNYEMVIEELQKVDYEDVWYNLNSKTMLLAAYYELDEIEVLDSMIGSFKVFISREKTLSGKRKKHYSNFLNFLQRLSRLDPRESSKITALEERIVNTQGVVSKAWLIEKVKQLAQIKSVRT